MRARSVIVLTFASVFVAAVAGMAWMYCQRDEVQARLDAFLAEQERRDGTVRTREAVYGATLDGDAADHYAAAARAIGDASTLLRGKEPLSPAARERIAPSLAAAQASIRSGVRCARLGRGDNSTGDLLARVVTDAVVAAFAADEVRNAVELFVDQCVYAIDTSRGVPDLPPFRDEWLRQLDAGTGSFLAAALQRLDERWPRHASAEQWIALVIRNELAHGHRTHSVASALDSYAYGFDRSWRALVLCDELLARVPALSPPAEQWPQRQAQYAAFGVGAVEPPRAFSDRLPWLMTDFERRNREQLARLRLLRLAVAFVCSSELPRLDDPLGSGAIEGEIRGDEATFRSEGTASYGKQRIERTVRRR